MIKNIKIDDKKSLKLDNNAGWLLIFRNQFGFDIMLTVMPAISALVKILADTVEDVGKDGKIDLKNLSSDSIDEALAQVANLQASDFIYIVWAMAKCADDKIDEPIKWLKGFKTFPMDVIIPEAGKLIVEGFISSKNLKRIQTAMKGLNPSALTQSFSQPLSAV